jgi:hypothetical protein
MRLAVVFVLVAIGGCSNQTAAELSAPKDAVTLAKKTVSDFRAQNMVELDKDAAPGLAKALKDRAVVQPILALFPDKPAIAEHVVYWSGVTDLGKIGDLMSGRHKDVVSNTVTVLSLRYEYQGGNAVRVNLTLARNFGRLYVFKMNVVALPYSLVAANAFGAHWDSVNGRHLFLLIALGVLVFIVATAIACLRTPELRFKWLWFIAIWASAVQLSLNWTRGHVFVSPLIVRFPPVWAIQESPYQPMIIWFLLPVGAIVFRIWKRIRGDYVVRPRGFGAD